MSGLKKVKFKKERKKKKVSKKERKKEAVSMESLFKNLRESSALFASSLHSKINTYLLLLTFLQNIPYDIYALTALSSVV